MHTDQFIFKHYDLTRGQGSLIIPAEATLMHTYYSVFQKWRAVVFEPWGKRNISGFKEIRLWQYPPANVILAKRVKDAFYPDDEWHRSYYPFYGRQRKFSMSPHAVIADISCGHLVVEQPDCESERVEREFALIGHGETVSDERFAHLDYVGCWSGNNGAHVLLEVFEVFSDG